MNPYNSPQPGGWDNANQGYPDGNSYAPQPYGQNPQGQPSHQPEQGQYGQPAPTQDPYASTQPGYDSYTQQPNPYAQPADPYAQQPDPYAQQPDPYAQQPAYDPGYGQQQYDPYAQQPAFDPNYGQPVGIGQPKQGMGTGVLIAIIVAIIVVIGGGAGGAFILLNKDDDDSGGSGDEKASGKSEKPDSGVGDFAPSGADYGADLPEGFEEIEKPTDLILSASNFIVAGLDGGDEHIVTLGDSYYPDAESEGFDSFKEIWGSDAVDIDVPDGKGFKVDLTSIGSVTYFIFHEDLMIEITGRWENDEETVVNAVENVFESLSFK